MSDTPSPLSLSLAAVVLVVVVTASLALVAGIAIGSGGLGGGSGGANGDSATADVASLQTFEPRCGTHRSSNSSTSVRPAADGYRLTVNETVPVAARDSDLTADIDEVGTDRYLLDLRRTAGNRSTDCYLEMRYNVTVALPDDEYTVIRTVDRTYHALEYGDRNSGGSSGSNLDPRPPSMNDSEWQAALNASDDYFYDESRGSDSSSGEGGGGSSGTAGSGGDRTASIAT